MSDVSVAKAAETPRGLIKSPQDFAAGLFLIVFALIALYGAWDLKFGQLRGIAVASAAGFWKPTPY